MMSSIHAGGTPAHGETGAADRQTEAERLAAGLASTLKNTQRTRFYHDVRFAEKAEIASSMLQEVRHGHPLSKLNRRRRKPLVLNRQVRRHTQADSKTPRADHGHRAHERSGKEGRHGGGGQGQGEGGEQQKDGERREKQAPLVVKIGKAKAIDPAVMSSGVLAAVQDPNVPPAQLEHDMRRALAARLLDIAKQLPGNPHARATAPVLGLSLELNAALQLLRGRGVTLTRAGLAGVKHVLLDVQDSVPTGASAQVTEARARSLNLLAPLMVLDAEHPSTPHQLTLAETRLRARLTAIGTAAEHGGTQPRAAEPAASQNP